MRRILPRTFFGQLFVSTVFVQTLLLVLFVTYIIVSQRKVSAARLQERMAQQLDHVSQSCARFLAKGDLESIHDYLELSRNGTTVDVARLTDPQGTTIAVTNNGVNRPLDADKRSMLSQVHGARVFQLKNRQMEAVEPISRDGKVIALLWFAPNPSFAPTTTAIVLRICLTYGAFALLANLLPIFLIVRTMTRPLNRLRDSTQRLVASPDKNVGFPLPVTSSNEAGQLTTSFNRMVDELEQQRNGLLETLALLDSMLGNAPIGFAFFDTDLCYVRVNDFLAHTHGLPVDQHLGHRITEFYPEKLAREKESCVSRVFATGEAIREVQLSGEMAHTPGVARSWQMHFYPIWTKQRTIKWVGAIVVEITERLQSEEALRKTEKLAAAGRLAASIAHEINNPLESVTNLLYLLSTHEPLDQEAMGYVQTAQAELARVSEITQQTLRFYRQSTSPTETNVVEMLDAIVKLYQPRLTASRVTVVRRFRAEPTLFGFNGELRQLFANLVGNAVDAMPTGGTLTFSARSQAGRLPDGTWEKGVRVCVADTGSGMSQATLQRIFEPFFTTKQATGTGLGLWVCDEIIRKHGGTVRIRTRQGDRSGTIFMLFFPDRHATMMQAALPPASKNKFKPVHLLN